MTASSRRDMTARRRNLVGLAVTRISETVPQSSHGLLVTFLSHLDMMALALSGVSTKHGAGLSIMMDTICFMGILG